MAHILALLMSGRRRGYTAGLWRAAIEGAEAVEGVTVDAVHAHDYRFGPCTSCFACIRQPESYCVLDDDMGRRGEGALFQKVREANGLLIAEPVHNWGSAATTRLFIERLYPFLWTGELSGMPFATIACASNQGMQHIAVETVARQVLGFRLRWVGGLAAHVALYEEARAQAQRLGHELAEAAQADSAGRRPLSDEEAWLRGPWSPLEPYLHNLTQGTFDAERSLLVEGHFEEAEARSLLAEAQPLLVKALAAWRAGELEAATRHLLAASALWTRATWLEFLEEDVIKAKQPEVYRPLPEED